MPSAMFERITQHAEGMSLRYDAIFIRAFGAPSIYPLSPHPPKNHQICTEKMQFPSKTAFF